MKGNWGSASPLFGGGSLCAIYCCGLWRGKEKQKRYPQKKKKEA